MFATTIDGKEVKVTFQHQRAAYRGQLTRPDIKWYREKDEEGKPIGNKKIRTIRKPVYALCFCFFNELCVGVAFCSYSDQSRYSKETGRQVALRNALKTALKRNGRSDRIVASERAQVWESYFRASTRRARCNPFMVGRAIHRQALMLDAMGEKGLLTGNPIPFPSEKDLNHTTPWKLGCMDENVRQHLNNEDINNSTIE